MKERSKDRVTGESAVAACCPARPKVEMILRFLGGWSC